MCVDANAGLRAQQKQKWREKNATFAQQGLKFFNKETSLARTQQRNVIGYGRDLSDAYVRALYTQGKGRMAVQEAAKKFYSNKTRGKALQGGRSKTAGRNAYLNYLGTAAKVDSVMEATFGRNMAYAQEGARRKFLNRNAKAREALGIPAAYGAIHLNSLGISLSVRLAKGFVTYFSTGFFNSLGTISSQNFPIIMFLFYC